MELDQGTLRAWLKRAPKRRRNRLSSTQVEPGVIAPKKIEHREGDLQIQLMQWWTWKHRTLGIPDVRLLMHIPNGADVSDSQRKILGAMGTRPGTPDLMLAVPRGKFHGLWLELKAGKRGVVRPDQKTFLAALRVQGYAEAVARTFGEATRMIEQYLATGADPGGSVT